ncbi:MAG: hypothetical protein EBU93_05490 [Chlamydiae bacterium]|nr:hypothetical protein [Chlamydiota bacterium]
MPNWVDNSATITAPTDMINEIKEILESDNSELLNYMVPQPKFQNDQDWYSWNVENWGTKWDISSPYINVSFNSAWSPPIAAFETWARSQENVTFQLDYFEPGMGFVGNASYDGEYLDEDFIEAAVEPENYKTKVRLEWGWDDEEEEPLTEWYKQGVEDKGLNK